VTASLSPPSWHNSVHNWLQAIGVPWLTPRSELISTYGIGEHPAYEWPAIQLDNGSGVSGLISPLWARAWRDEWPGYPATSWSGETSFGDDAHLNIEKTAAEIGEILGEAAIYPVNNTLSCTWMDGSARVRLTAWPPDMQRFDMGSNPSHERDPRLVTACHLTIHTGWLPAPSEKELEWLRGFRSLFDIEGTRNTFLRLEPPPESYLPVIRAKTEGFATGGRIGLSSDDEAIIFETRYLFVVPRKNGAKVELQRIRPARGPGGSTLDLTFDVMPGVRKGELLFHHADLDGLDSLAKEVSGGLGAELVVRPDADDD